MDQKEIEEWLKHMFELLNELLKISLFNLLHLVIKTISKNLKMQNKN